MEPRRSYGSRGFRVSPCPVLPRSEASPVFTPPSRVPWLGLVATVRDADPDGGGLVLVIVRN